MFWADERLILLIPAESTIANLSFFSQARHRPKKSPIVA
jgi:hypothetical protein